VDSEDRARPRLPYHEEVDVAVVVVPAASLVVAVDDAAPVGTTDGALTKTVRVLVEVRPF